MKKICQKVLVVLFVLIAFALVALPFWASAESIPNESASDLATLVQQYAVAPVVVVCLAVGCVLKHAWEAFNTKLVPVVLLPIGIVGVLWMRGWAFTPENAFAGFCSAAIAVYLHSTGKHVMEYLKPPEH